MRMLAATALATAAAGCGEAEPPEPEVVCTLVGCGPGVVIETGREVRSAWPGATRVRVCVTELQKCEVSAARSRYAVLFEDLAGHRSVEVRFTALAGRRIVFRDRLRARVRRSYPNGRGCGTCHNVRLRVEDRELAELR